MAEELKISNQPEEENQPEPEKAESVDNRLPYEKPLLRKHGKIHDATKATPFPNPTIDNPFGPFRDNS